MNSFDKASTLIAFIISLSILGIVKMATDYGIAVEQTKAHVEITRTQHLCSDD